MAFEFFRKKPGDFSSPEIPPQLQNLQDLPPLPDMGPPPIDEMRAQGMSPRDIVRDLTARGYPSADILSRFQTPQNSPASYPQQQMPMPPAPSPSFSRFSSPAKPSTDEIQEIAEKIVEEKWKGAEKEIDTIKKWRDETETNLSNLSDRMTKLEMKMDSVEQAILGKVDEYGRAISDVGTELKAMQRVFSTTMPAFTENIKELQGLVEETKEKRRKK